uniref:Peptidase A1 domain-containing protein n=1 Tax=Kalanchoe fedtschenkoi TaxID=63787 RepID=A0A7N0T0G4_KALFE
MSISRICIALSLFVSFSLLISFSAAQTRGFSTKIYHRDSPASPFYDPALTLTERIRRSAARSIARANRYRLDASTDSPKATITGDGGEYLMNISLGTPAFPIVAIADTGSDLIWTQCAPCSSCYTQKLPLFNPKKSRTFRELPCDSTACPSDSSSGCTDDNKCGYTVGYGDGSSTNGVISTETITLESTSATPVKLPKYIFGCGFDNQGTFSPEGSGIIGLGGGSESLVSQLGDQINGKFSYCLVPLGSGDGTSTINFGKAAAVSGRGVVKTPLVKKSPDTFYYLTLNGFTVGEDKVLLSGGSSGNAADAEEGNIIIDSGTTLVILPSEFYSQLESAVSKKTSGTPAQDSSGTFSLCYTADNSFKPPTITANWAGGDVELKPFNTFVKISDEVVCFAFAASDNLAIFGNLAQMNFLVGYDKVGGTVSFQPADCTQA